MRYFGTMEWGLLPASDVQAFGPGIEHGFGSKCRKPNFFSALAQAVGYLKVSHASSCLTGASICLPCISADDNAVLVVRG